MLKSMYEIYGGSNMQYAVELYFDKATEQKLLTLPKEWQMRN